MNFNNNILYQQSTSELVPSASQAIGQHPLEILDDPLDFFVDFGNLVSGSPEISRSQKLKTNIKNAMDHSSKNGKKTNGKPVPWLVTPQHKLLRAKDKTGPKIRFVKSSTKNKWSKSKRACTTQKRPIGTGKVDDTGSDSSFLNTVTPNKDIVTKSSDNIESKIQISSYTNPKKTSRLCKYEEQPLKSSLKSQSSASVSPKMEEIEPTEPLENLESSSGSLLIEEPKSLDSSVESIFNSEPSKTPTATSKKQPKEDSEDLVDIFVDFKELVARSGKSSNSQELKKKSAKVHSSNKNNLRNKGKKQPRLITPQHKLLRAKNKVDSKPMFIIRSSVKNKCSKKKSACTALERPAKLGEASATPESVPESSSTNTMTPVKDTVDKLTSKVELEEQEKMAANCLKSEEPTISAMKFDSTALSTPKQEDFEHSDVLDSAESSFSEELSSSCLDSSFDSIFDTDSINEQSENSSESKNNASGSDIWLEANFADTAIADALTRFSWADDVLPSIDELSDEFVDLLENVDIVFEEGQEVDAFLEFIQEEHLEQEHNDVYEQTEEEGYEEDFDFSDSSDDFVKKEVLPAPDHRLPNTKSSILKGSSSASKAGKLCSSVVVKVVRFKGFETEEEEEEGPEPKQTGSEIWRKAALADPYIAACLKPFCWADEAAKELPLVESSENETPLWGNEKPSGNRTWLDIWYDAAMSNIAKSLSAAANENTDSEPETLTRYSKQAFESEKDTSIVPKFKSTSDNKRRNFRSQRRS